MKTLCIIPCGKKKIWDKNPNAGKVKAKDVYIGNFSIKCKIYAEKFYANSWCILSAKYGFIFPEDQIPGPYNVSFNNRKTNPIMIDDLILQIEQKGLKDYEKVIVLGGKSYTKMVNDSFKGKIIHNPLSIYKGLGYMMQHLNESIKNGCEL
jgi:hypothetical protein